MIYRNSSLTTLKSPDSVSHSALRFITDDPYNVHHCVLYEKVGWSSLFIYKSLADHSPLHITEKLSVINAVYQTRSSDWITLQVLRAFTELGKSDFSYSTTELEFITGISKASLSRLPLAWLKLHPTRPPRTPIPRTPCCIT